jgi:hypothetical protein
MLKVLFLYGTISQVHIVLVQLLLRRFEKKIYQQTLVRKEFGCFENKNSFEREYAYLEIYFVCYHFLRFDCALSYGYQFSFITSTGER